MRRKVFSIAAAAVLALLGATVAGRAQSSASAPSFTRARSYPTAPWPTSVAIGDLNGDGKLDLAVATVEEGLSSGVSVLLNRGHGRFGPRRSYRSGIAVAVEIGDLNGDGAPDLATANFEDNTVSVLLNRGDGRFRAALDYRTGSGPDSVAIGDLNGDGAPDLATANFEDNTVSVLLNRGDGSFEGRVDYRAGHGADSISMSDLNGDAKPDLVTANGYAPTVSVLLNRGDGTFPPRRNYRTGWNPISLAIGDLNGDHRPDLATANGSARTVSVLANRGDGSFQRRRDYPRGGGGGSVAIGDMDGNRTPELVVTNYGAGRNAVSVFVNSGGGHFEAKVDYRTDRRPVDVAIGDLNGDDKLDLATANNARLPAGAGNVSVLVNRPGFCTVQDVRRQSLPAAKRTIPRANCRVGKIGRAYSKTVKRDHVISQKPKFGAVLPNRGKVDLVVSRGKTPS